MPNDFHTMVFHKNIVGKAGYHVHLEVQQDSATNIDPSPRKNPDGSFIIPIIQPSDDKRHLALGKLMDEWSKLESALSHLLSVATNTPPAAINALMNSLGMKGVLDTIRALAPLRIPATELDKLESLLGRTKSNNTRRNYIVHGYWMLELVVIDCGGHPILKYHQYRQYAPTDPKLLEQLSDPSNRKVRSTYMFSIARLHGIARGVSDLRKDIESFTAPFFKQLLEATK